MYFPSDFLNLIIIIIIIISAIVFVMNAYIDLIDVLHFHYSYVYFFSVVLIKFRGFLLVL